MKILWPPFFTSKYDDLDKLISYSTDIMQDMKNGPGNKICGFTQLTSEKKQHSFMAANSYDTLKRRSPDK